LPAPGSSGGRTTLAADALEPGHPGKALQNQLNVLILQREKQGLGFASSQAVNYTT
jgi:hypothetical protein